MEYSRRTYMMFRNRTLRSQPMTSRSALTKSLTALGAAAGLALMALVAFTAEPRFTLSRVEGPAADFGKVSEEMAAAATGFWKSLTPEQQAKARFEFKDEERLNW